MSSRPTKWMTVLYVYLMLAVIAIVLANTGKCCGEQGILATVLGLPWTVIGMPVMDAIDPELIGRFGPVLAYCGIAINAALLFFFARRRSARREPGGRTRDN